MNRLLAVNFAAGFVEGFVEGQAEATGHTEIGLFLASSPVITYVATTQLFEDDFTQASDPKKLCRDAFVAGFMGSLAGDIIRLNALKPEGYVFKIVANSLAKVLVAILLCNKVERNAPPPSLSV